jgi:hypothetical protein
MDVTLARVGDGAQPDGKHADPTGREVGDDRRGQTDKGQFPQRNTGASI